MMSWTSCLGFWRSSPKRVRAQRRCSRRQAILRFRPSLEALEGRVLPSTIIWINPAGGDWDTASNWSAGRLPGTSDEVIIDIPGVTVTHSAAMADSIHSLVSQDAIRLSRGSLALAGPSTVTNALTVSGGNLSGPGALTVRGLFTWTGGTMSLNGLTVANAGPATPTSTGAHGGPQTLPPSRHAAPRAMAAIPADLVRMLVFMDANAFAAPATAVTINQMPPPAALIPSGMAIPSRHQGSLADGGELPELSEVVLEAPASPDPAQPSDLALSALSQGALRFQALDQGQAMGFRFDSDSTTDSVRTTVPTADAVPDERFVFPDGAEDEGALAPAETDGDVPMTHGLMGVEAPALTPRSEEGERLLDAQREPALAEEGPHDSRERVVLVLACLFGPMLRASADRAQRPSPRRSPLP
jgi:hypothetical protein